MKDASILIVEDEAIVAKSIEKRLRSLGYRVTGTAASGEETLAILEKSKPDLILLDIRLEGKMDGVETSRIIHERFRIPVIFITAYSDNATIERATKTGPYGYLLKPFGETDLQSTLQTVLYRIEHERSEAKKRGPNESVCQEIFEQLSVAMAVVYPDKKITLVNRAFEQLLGYSRTEIIEKVSLFDLIEPQDIQKVSEFMDRFLADAPVDSGSVTTKVQTRSSGRRAVIIRFGRLPNIDGVVVSFLEYPPPPSL
ncbi:MAG: response regulator [Methanoregula sp.]|nr:response regulator [Methanoregula sp.]